MEMQEGKNWWQMTKYHYPKHKKVIPVYKKSDVLVSWKMKQIASLQLKLGDS